MESPGLFFTCCYCRNELTESQILDFRGSVGCENCVRDYYRDHPASEIDFQLRARRASAVNWLNRNRRALERAAKTTPKKSNHAPVSTDTKAEPKNEIVP